MTAGHSDTFDVVIIGGGITGCGVARDAAMRGLNVALVERDDFASGTSGRSSRLIHGGIRYLEHGQLHLVYESIRERQTLLRIAPHLVKPLAFTWPIYRGARVGRLKLRAGLFLYRLMAGRHSLKHSTLTAAQTLEREPRLKSDALTGGAVYYDACTDDARLVIANALAAQQLGATMLSHARVTEIIRHGEKAVGVMTISQHSQKVQEIRGRVIVNATGVWQNAFDGEAHARSVRGSKGAHIAVARERIGNRDALTLTSPLDGRVMFCLPAGSQAIIGTTDTWTEEPPETVHASPADVEYLLGSANAYFPQAHLTPDDVISAWAGIRPLAGAGASNPSAVSREHAVTTDRSGVINVTGGKLTTYRSMAAEIVDRVQETLGQPKKLAPTDEIELPGADRANEIARIQRTVASLSTPLVSGLAYTGAHLVYAVQKEMAQTLSDLLVRRTHIAFETHDHGKSVSLPAADMVAPLLGWDDRTKSTRLREYHDDIERMFAVRSDGSLDRDGRRRLE